MIPSLGRASTFQLKNGVAIKGGYAGFGHPDPNARNTNMYRTTLSGDLNGDDILNSGPDGLEFTNYGDNCYHVVLAATVDATAVLDGVTITAGNASDLSYPDWRFCGGGMFCDNASPTLIDCRFFYNSALYGGGGLYNSQGNPKLTNCTFYVNHAPSHPNWGSGNGAGMFNDTGNSVLTKCTFANNRSTGTPGNSDGHGGGLFCYVRTMEDIDKGPTLIECLTYRHGGHSRADPAHYRTKVEVDEWLKKDPVSSFKNLLFETRVLTADQDMELERSVLAEIEEAVEYAKASPFPRPETALEDIYA